MLTFFLEKKYIHLYFVFALFISLFFIINNSVTDSLVALSYDTNGKHLSDAEIREKYYKNFEEGASYLRHDRSFQGFRDGDTRHKLRWVYRTFEIEYYKFISGLLHFNGLAIVVLTNALYVFVGFLFTFLALSRCLNQYNSFFLHFSGLTFFTLFTIILSHGYQDVYAYVEMLAIAGGLYFAFRNNMYCFLLLLSLAVIDRESGVIMSLIYPIIHPKNKISYIPICYAPILLLLINYDLIFNASLYNVANYIPITENYAISLSIKNYIYLILFYIIFSFPFLLMLWNWKTSNLLIKKTSYISMIYIVVAIVGKADTDIFGFMLCLPGVICCLSLLLAEKYPFLKEKFFHTIVKTPSLMGQQFDVKQA